MKFNMQGKLNFRFGKQNSRLSAQPSPLLSFLWYGGPWSLLASPQPIALWYLLLTLFLVSKPVSSPSCWGQDHILTLFTNSVTMPGLCSLQVGFFSQTLGDGSSRKQSSLDSCSKLAYHWDLYLPVQVSHHAGFLSFIACLTLSPCLAPCPSISPLNLEWSLVRWAKPDIARPQWAGAHPKTVSITPTGVLWARSWHLLIQFLVAPCSILTLRAHFLHAAWLCARAQCWPTRLWPTPRQAQAVLLSRFQHLGHFLQFTNEKASVFWQLFILVWTIDSSVFSGAELSESLSPSRLILLKWGHVAHHQPQTQDHGSPSACSSSWYSRRTWRRVRGTTKMLTRGG